MFFGFISDLKSNLNPPAPADGGLTAGAFGVDVPADGGLTGPVLGNFDDGTILLAGALGAAALGPGFIALAGGFGGVALGVVALGVGFTFGLFGVAVGVEPPFGVVFGRSTCLWC